MDFKNSDGLWKLKRFCITSVELIFKLCLGEFYFQFEFFFYFDFQMHKTYIKSFVFEIIFIRDHSSTFLSL